MQVFLLVPASTFGKEPLRFLDVRLLAPGRKPKSTMKAGHIRYGPNSPYMDHIGVTWDLC